MEGFRVTLFSAIFEVGFPTNSDDLFDEKSVSNITLDAIRLRDIPRTRFEARNCHPWDEDVYLPT